MARKKKKKKGKGKGKKGPQETIESLLGISQEDLTAYEYDPLYLQSRGWAGDIPDDVHPGTAGLDFPTMRMMAGFPLVAAIITRRVQQLAEFCARPESPWSIGTCVKLRDPKAKMTRAAEKRAKELEDLIFAMGGKYGNGNYDRWMRMHWRDSLILDAAVSEKIRTRRGQCVGLKAFDASTVRRSKPTPEALNRGHMRPDEKGWIQLVQNQIVSTWDEDGLSYTVRRPRTDMNTFGYGFPELDELVNVVTWLLNASTYNGVAFTNGVHASTMLLVRSAMEPQKFRQFQRFVRAMLSGPRNALKTPFLQLNPDKNEDVKAVSLGGDPKDMMWKEFTNFWFKVLCALFLMDPAELGFVFGNEGQTQSLSGQGPAERIKYSKETGLRPMVRLTERILTEDVVHTHDEDFKVVLQGLDVMTQQERLDLDIKKVSNLMTLNEVRANWDLEALDSPAADMVMNNVYLQAAQQAAMAEQGPYEEPGGDAYEGEGEEALGFPSGVRTPEEETEPAQKAYDMDGHTRWLAGGVEKAFGSGRISAKGGKLPRGPWVPIESGCEGVRAWAVEVEVEAA